MYSTRAFVFLLIFICKTFGNNSHKIHQGENEICILSNELIEEIQSYQDTANEIIDYIVSGDYKGQTWYNLGNFTDNFGPRLAGTQHFEDAVDYMLDWLQREGLENVHGEDATVPHWERGEESATLLSPRTKNLAMLGLGTSIGTAPGGITAEAIVVRDFNELQAKARQAVGRIVVFNEEYISYGHAVQYRNTGASEASKVGAVAVLVRSVTPNSIYTPHTGYQGYENNVTQIPAACITIEDAEMLQRMQDRGETLKINLKMGAQNFPPVTSRNTISELVGTTLPNQTLYLSGHLDSWDVGQGSMDDGGGAFIGWNALVALKRLGLRAKRTLRSIQWTCDEFYSVGAQAYYNDHESEIPSVDLIMESDEGTFTPHGINFSGSKDAGCILKEIAKLLSKINATDFSVPADGISDAGPWLDAGVPGVSVINENENYFWFHHSNGDTMTVEQPDSLDRCTAVWAVTAYVVADLSIQLPRTERAEDSDIVYGNK